MTKHNVAIALFALACLAPFGVKAQGDACALLLTPDGKTIYEAARAANPTLPNLRETMVTVVKGLVAAGKIAPAGARDNGAAAGQCLASTLRVVPQGPPKKAPANATVSWISQKVVVGGISYNCGGNGFQFSDYKVEINGSTFKATPLDGDSHKASSVVMDIKSLKPDGSGRIIVTSKNKGQAWTWDFDAGHGPRKIQYGNEFSSCRYAFVPK